MTDCIFCRILAGQSPVSMVYQDELCSAFMDIRPVNAGHLLVIPNTHAANLGDLDEELGAQMFRVAHRLAQAVRKSGVRCEGVNLFLADGEAAFQEVFHVHLHVIPRYDGDGFRLRFSPDYYVLPERSELDTLAERISRAL
jgi:histidine triad (HIT) family protein